MKLHANQAVSNAWSYILLDDFQGVIIPKMKM